MGLINVADPCCDDEYVAIGGTIQKGNSMTGISNSSSRPTYRSGLGHAPEIICGFAAVLFWWIGLTGYFTVGGPASGGGGLAVFVAVPALATAGTYVLARRARRTASSPAAPTRLRTLRTRRLPVRSRRGTRDAILVVSGFAAVLFWLIGLTGYFAVGGVASGVAGAGVFLAVPAAVTAGTYLAGRRRRGPAS